MKGIVFGLALVRRIAELHDGRVWVRSDPGRGSEFFFALPPRPVRSCADPVAANSAS